MRRIFTIIVRYNGLTRWGLFATYLAVLFILNSCSSHQVNVGKQISGNKEMQMVKPRIVIAAFTNLHSAKEMQGAEKRLEVNLESQLQQTKRFVTVGLYDSFTKKYEMFDTVNYAGNFRYDKNIKPDEFVAMEKMVADADR